MDLLQIRGGIPLQGRVSASGAKNAALPIMAASILACEPVTLGNVPHLADVDILSLLLGYLGVEVKRQRDDRLHIATVAPQRIFADFELVEQMRASFCVLGPLLARRGRAVVPLPGGCQIGDRPIDLHLHGLSALGADLRIQQGHVVGSAKQLRGTRIHLAGPCGPTVTGTANVLSAATLARGRTIITGAATEPEVVDLGNYLNRLGARIEGLGTSTLEIVGVERLAGGSHSIIPDRIETATLLLAAAITRGSVEVTDVAPEHLDAILAELDRAGLHIETGTNTVRVASTGRLRAIEISALPYPGIPTDVQAQFMALACMASGRSTVRDCVFPERFRHVEQLRRFGAQIDHAGDRATIDGATNLVAANVTACDLRASAALVLAGLAAEGETLVRRIHHLDRGYQRLEEKLARLGANIQRIAEHAPSHPATTKVPSLVPSPGRESRNQFAARLPHRIPGLTSGAQFSSENEIDSNYFDPR